MYHMVSIRFQIAGFFKSQTKLLGSQWGSDLTYIFNAWWIVGFMTGV